MMKSWIVEVCVLAVLCFACQAYADPGVGERIRAALQDGQSAEMVYKDSAFAEIEDALEANPSEELFSLKSFLMDAGMFERAVALAIYKNAEVSLHDLVRLIVPTTNYEDKDDVEAVARIIRNKLTMEVDGPDYASLSTMLPVLDHQLQTQLVRWMYHDHVFGAIDSVASYSCAEDQDWDLYRQAILHARNIEDSAWREYRTFIPDGTMTEEASASLDAMLRADAWWMRLAGVEIMGRYTYMRTPERLGFLADETEQVILECIEYHSLRGD